MQHLEETTILPATSPLHMLFLLHGTFCEVSFKSSRFLFILQIPIIIFLKEASLTPITTDTVIHVIN